MADSGRIQLDDNVNVLLTDPSFNVRRSSKRSRSEHDVFISSDFSDMMNLSADCQRMGVHGILFLKWYSFRHGMRL